MFFQQPTPPPPLHSLILQSILQHLHGNPLPPGTLYPAQAGGRRPAPGGVQPPQRGIAPGGRPAPGQVQPPQSSPVGLPGDPYPGGGPVRQDPYGVSGDPFGGGGYGPPRDLVHRIVSGLL